MIFKQLFTPKWKHPKLAIRLNALNSLDNEQSKHLDILQQLAFEDSAIEVRQKALNKLNSITNWWQAYKSDEAKEIKDLAEQHISKAVMKNESGLSAEKKSEYIDSCTKMSVLEKLALENNDSNLRIKLLKRIAKPSLIEKAFKQADEKFQLAIFDLIEQYNLYKSCKNQAKGEVTKKIEEKLIAIQYAKEQPEIVEKEAKLILAKMNALRDKTDFTLVKQQTISLENSWQAIELNWLSQDTLATLSEKYTVLNEKLQSKLTLLEQAYLEKMAIEEHNVKQQALVEEFNSLITISEQKVKTALAEPSLTPTNEFNQLVDKANELLSNIEGSIKGKLEQRLIKLTNQIALIPELIEVSNTFNQHLSQYSALLIPEGIADYDNAQVNFEQWRKEAVQIIKTLPAAFKPLYQDKLKSHTASWATQTLTLKQNLDLNQKQTEKKLRDLKRLLDQGRYNVAFGVFKGMNELYQTLTPKYQAKLQQSYEAIEVALNKAKDWQEYAAEPKRDELLTQLAALVKEENVDPKKRTHDVKNFRRYWNELGKAITDEAKDKSAQFDKLLEEAFAPCRTFFAKQDELRAENLALRQTLVNALIKLADLPAETVQDFKVLSTELNKINKQWRQAGPVASGAYQEILEAYKVAEKPIANLIKAHQKGNAELKTDLVQQAKALAELQDANEACEQLKKLQSKWKTIGFAGNKVENELWQAFRVINDEIFKVRETDKAVEEQASRSQFKELEQRFIAITAAIDENVDDKTALLKWQKDLAALQNEVPAKLEEIIDKINIAKKKIKTYLTKIDQIANLAKLNSLFNALENGEEIDRVWVKDVKQGKLQRQQITVRMEILSQIENPDSDVTLKMAEQIAMLSDKMHGDAQTLENLLYQWINAGELTADDKLLLQRVKAIYLK